MKVVAKDCNLVQRETVKKIIEEVMQGIARPRKIDQAAFTACLNSLNCDDKVDKEQILTVVRFFVNKVDYKQLPKGAKQMIFSYSSSREIFKHNQLSRESSYLIKN